MTLYTGPTGHAIPAPIPPIDNTHRSPNFWPGRHGYTPRLWVRHNTETTGSGNAPSLAWFCSKASGVSIYHLVARDGTRYDPVQRADTAYQCGDSAWGADHGSVEVAPGEFIALLNLISLGMEWESTSDRNSPGDGYTDAQLWTGAYTEACSIISYAIPLANCVDHRQIALPGGRRVDPSHFPMVQYLSYRDAWLVCLRGLPPADLPKYCL